MAVLHSARRYLASAVLLAVGLTGCSQNDGPSQFNPEGMSSDLGSPQVAFDSPISASSMPRRRNRRDARCGGPA